MTGDPEPVGAAWAGYRPAALAAVQPSPATITNFVLVDVVTGQPFNRPAGTTGSNDTPRSQPVPPPQPAPTTRVGGPGPIQPEIDGTYLLHFQAGSRGTAPRDATVTMTRQGNSLTLVHTSSERQPGIASATARLSTQSSHAGPVLPAPQAPWRTAADRIRAPQGLRSLVIIALEAETEFADWVAEAAKGNNMDREVCKFLSGSFAALAYAHAGYAVATSAGIIDEPVFLGRRWGVGTMWTEAAIYSAVSLALGYVGWIAKPQDQLPEPTTSSSDGQSRQPAGAREESSLVAP